MNTRQRQPPLSYYRRWSRRLALQALYQWHMTGEDIGEIERQFGEDQELHKSDAAYFQELLHGVPASVVVIDEHLAGHVERAMDSVDPVERAILRIASYELIYRPDVPYKVVINEAVSLAKQFGGEGSHTFINGVLDKLAPQLRTRDGEPQSPPERN